MDSFKEFFFSAFGFTLGMGLALVIVVFVGKLLLS